MDTEYYQKRKKRCDVCAGVSKNEIKPGKTPMMFYIPVVRACAWVGKANSLADLEVTLALADYTSVTVREQQSRTGWT
jgi:hypothetical protein